MTKKVLFSWSGGKDSAMALFQLLSSRGFKISTLLTTVTEDFDRISMHGVRRVLLEKQAKSLGLPLEKIKIPKNSSNEEYETEMKRVLLKYKNHGVLSVVFGDIFLENLKKYREEKLAQIGMKGIFPIWKKDTSKLAKSFINQGFKAVITCVDSKILDKKFVGREFDQGFLTELPSNVDPCGENGEFHSFVYRGPIFQKPILHKKGKVLLRNKRFYYCDLIPI